MEAQVNGTDRREGSPSAFPYANWGPWMAVGGVVLALVAGALLAIPAVLLGHNGNEPTGLGNAFAQLMAEAAFLMVPMLLAARRGAPSLREAARRLGIRDFPSSAWKPMLAAIGIYLVFSIAYAAIVQPAPQKHIAEKLGPVPIQVLVIAIAAPIGEETCFRGFLFGGLRERLPRVPAALISGAVFGVLHATTGVGVVPVLAGFGFILALLYERTGSIIPGIILHMLNNTVALLGQ